MGLSDLPYKCSSIRLYSYTVLFVAGEILTSLNKYSATAYRMDDFKKKDI